MPNVLDANGLQTSTREEVVTALETGFKDIYGNDINLDSDSLDGQLINILAQAIVDNYDLINQVLNSVNPDNAIGRALDQRVGLTGIQRQGGTYSRTNISITTNKALTLYGLDQEVEEVFTVSDDEGNEWELLETYVFGSGATTALLFQSSIEGQVLTTPNTITKPVTIILGVETINNPDPQTVIGEDEETDEELRLRRQISTSINAQGYLESLRAMLLNISGITDAFVYENNTDATDIDGVPSHSIWVIVSGNYDQESVAQAIYQKRNAGCGMFGTNIYNVTQVDGTLFPIKWDDVTIVNPWVNI